MEISNLIHNNDGHSSYLDNKIYKFSHYVFDVLNWIYNTYMCVRVFECMQLMNR